MRFIKFLTSTSLFLALSGALVVLFSCFLYEVTISIQIILIGFLAIFSIYGINKVTDKTEDSINRPEIASKKTMFYLVPSIVSLLASIAIGFINGLKVLLIILTPVIVGIIYSIRILPCIPRLKEIAGVKSLAVAFCWAFTGSLLPVAIQLVPIEKIFLIFSYIFIQLLINTIIFDAIDMEGDAFSGLKTIPLVLGKRKTKNLLLIINSLLGIWLIYCVLNEIFLTYLPALVFGFIYGYVLIWAFFERTCKRFYADIFVDGQWLPMLAILRFIML